MGDGELAKTLLPYLRRATEIQKYEPLVAYHCKLYATNRLLKIPSNERNKATQVMLSTLMQQLTEDRKSIQLSSNDSLYVEDFAMSMFMRADKQERSGKADMRTAKTFYVASLFFEILQNFSDVRFDQVEQKQKYAAWKAAEIYKTLKGKAKRSLKKGSQPSSGRPGDKAFSALIGGFASTVLKSDKLAADALESRPPSEESSALGLKVDVGKERLPSSTMLSSEGPSASGPTLSTMTSNLDNGDESDDGDSFYDCSEAELSALSSSDSEHEMDLTNSVTVDVASESYGHSFAETSDVANESSGPSVAETSDAANESYGSSVAETSNIAETSDAANESSGPSVAEISKAHKAARLAVSALAFDDVPSAISYLEQALDILTTGPLK